MFLIGICGASGSGKSTLAADILRASGDTGLVIPQDSYYLDHSDLSFEERCAVNYDEPTVFDHDALLNDVKDLLAGRSITKKAYDYSRHARADTDEVITPGDMLIVEGIHVFYDHRLLQLMDLKIYLDVEQDICLLRRIRRDIKERGREIDGIGDQYLKTVKPMYEKYIRNYANEADVIAGINGHTEKLVSLITGFLRDRTEGK